MSVFYLQHLSRFHFAINEAKYGREYSDWKPLFPPDLGGCSAGRFHCAVCAHRQVGASSGRAVNSLGGSSLGDGGCVGGKTLRKAGYLGCNAELTQAVDQSWLVDRWFVPQTILPSSLIQHNCLYLEGGREGPYCLACRKMSTSGETWRLQGTSSVCLF